METSTCLVACPSGEIFSFDLPPNFSICIGRQPPCSIVLEDPSVSRIHCSIESREGDLFLRDEGSKNGTSVNDRVLARGEAVLLHDGDTVRIAKSLYIFRRIPKGKDAL